VSILPPPPRQPLNPLDYRSVSMWQRQFYEPLYRILGKVAGVSWDMVSKGGSKLSDIEERPHSQLQSIDGWTTGVSTTQNKHISQANGKKWEDHVNITDGDPHGTITVGRLGTAIAGANEKATPVDGDSLGLSDSESADVLKKLTWTNVKATLKTYFDGIYITLPPPPDTINEYTLTTIGGVYVWKLSGTPATYDDGSGITYDDGGAVTGG
jgi:hypothetical protein